MDPIIGSSYSYDMDDPNSKDYCKKTDYRESGRVDIYNATNGDFEIGHGHTVKDSEGNTVYDRNPNDPDSFDRSWDERN